MERTVSEFYSVLHRLYVIIRSNIGNQNNIHFIHLINKHLQLFSADMFDKELFEKEVNELYDRAYGDLFLNIESTSCNNLEVVYKFIPFITGMNRLLEKCIASEDNQQVYEIVDAIHCMPVALLKKETWNFKRYFRDYLKPIRKYEGVSRLLAEFL